PLAPAAPRALALEQPARAWRRRSRDLTRLSAASSAPAGTAPAARAVAPAASEEAPDVVARCDNSRSRTSRRRLGCWWRRLHRGRRRLIRDRPERLRGRVTGRRGLRNIGKLDEQWLTALHLDLREGPAEQHQHGDERQVQGDGDDQADERPL